MPDIPSSPDVALSRERPYMPVQAPDSVGDARIPEPGNKRSACGQSESRTSLFGLGLGAALFAAGGVFPSGSLGALLTSGSGILTIVGAAATLAFRGSPHGARDTLPRGQTTLAGDTDFPVPVWVGQTRQLVRISWFLRTAASGVIVASLLMPSGGMTIVLLAIGGGLALLHGPLVRRPLQRLARLLMLG